MNTFQRVTQMQQQGYSEPDITKRLQEEGVPPAEINDAFNQSQIKTAVAGSEQNIQEPLPENQPSPEVSQESQGLQGAPPIPPPLEQTQQQGYQDQYAAPTSQEQFATSQSQEYANPYPQDPVAQDYYTQTPQAYAGQEYSQDYYAPGATDTETITEIASQITAEKIEELRKETGDIKGFEEATKEKIKNLDNRLKKIEDSIHHLTQSILGKVAEFGQNSTLIHKDLDNLHDTVSKLMGKKLDEHHKKHTHTHHHSHAKKKKK